MVVLGSPICFASEADKDDISCKGRKYHGLSIFWNQWFTPSYLAQWQEMQFTSPLHMWCCVSVVLLLKSTLQGVTDTPFVQVMVESNDSAHTGGTNIHALVNTEVARIFHTLGYQGCPVFPLERGNLDLTKNRVNPVEIFANPIYSKAFGSSTTNEDYTFNISYKIFS